MDYVYKTQPYKHQEEAFLKSRDKEYFAYLMEQGTGKTKVTIDVGSWLYAKGQVSAMVVLAPKVVHQNWAEEEVPIHVPEWTNPKYLCWTGKTTKAWLKEFDALVNHEGFSIYCVNYDSVLSERSESRLISLMKQRSTLLVLDESTRIKNRSSKRTKKIMKYSALAPYRRILTGTPVTNNPFDLWTQMCFLSRSILPYRSYTDFKCYFATFEDHVTVDSSGREYRYETVKSYKNLNELSEHINEHSFRVLKDDCLDLPDKVYQKIYVEMEGEQSKVYRELKDQAMFEFEDIFVTAPMALTLAGKLRQILGGSIKLDDGTTQILKTNAKLDALKQLLEDDDTPTIIWTAYRAEKTMIMGLLDKLKISYKEMTDIKDAQEFQEGGFQVLLSNLKVGSVGLTLHRAKRVIYYSNDFSYETRIQSEDRVHRSGLKHSVSYIDILIRRTMDEKILKALRSKRSFSDLITKDPIKEWL